MKIAEFDDVCSLIHSFVFCNSSKSFVKFIRIRNILFLSRNCVLMSDGRFQNLMTFILQFNPLFSVTTVKTFVKYIRIRNVYLFPEIICILMFDGRFQNLMTFIPWFNHLFSVTAVKTSVKYVRITNVSLSGNPFPDIIFPDVWWMIPEFDDVYSLIQSFVFCNSSKNFRKICSHQKFLSFWKSLSRHYISWCLMDDFRIWWRLFPDSVFGFL